MRLRERGGARQQPKNKSADPTQPISFRKQKIDTRACLPPFLSPGTLRERVSCLQPHGQSVASPGVETASGRPRVG